MLPQNRELEASILSALVLNPKNRFVESLCSPDDFYHYRDIAEHIWGKDTTVELLAEELRGSRSASEIVKLLNGSLFPSTREGLEKEAARLKELGAVRSAYRAASDLVQTVDEGLYRIEDASDCMTEISKAISGTYTDKPEHLKDLLLRYWQEEIDTRLQNPGQVIGVQTGLQTLDRYLSGLVGGRLIIVAARPGEGKTTLMLNMADGCSKHVPVYIGSAEMSKNELTGKLVHMKAKVDSQKGNMAAWTDEELRALAYAASQLTKSDIIIDDSPGLSLEQIIARSKELKADRNIGVIFVDYLQLLKTRYRGDNRADIVGHISRELKTLARTLNVPVVALAQLNREVERRSEPKPTLADLKESGSLEQDAAQVLFIWRDNGKTQVTLAKNRFGPAGKDLPFRFNKPFGIFEEAQ